MQTIKNQRITESACRQREARGSCKELMHNTLHFTARVALKCMIHNKIHRPPAVNGEPEGDEKAQPGRLGFIWNPGAGDDVCQFGPEAGPGPEGP